MLLIGLAWAGSIGLSRAEPAAEPQPRPDFSGHWVFNAKASDDPQEKVKDAMRALQQERCGGWRLRAGKGNVLVAETTIHGGTRLVRHYQIDAENGRLTISDAANLAERQALTFRLEFDRLKPGTDAGEMSAVASCARVRSCN